MLRLQNARYFKLINVALSFIICFSLIFPDAKLYAQTDVSVGAQFIAPTGVINQAPTFALPSHLGKIKEFYLPESAAGRRPFIIHIQDAHANPDAQKKIKGILEYLKTKTRSQFSVAVEGAKGPLHPEYLNFFPQFPEINEAIIQDLLSKGELSGAEWFAWEESKRQPTTDHRRQTISFAGIEEPSVYRENLRIYQEHLFKRNEIQNLLQPLRQKLDSAQSRILSPELRKFLQEKSRRKDGDYGSREIQSPQFLAYLDFLIPQAREKAGIDLSEKIEQLRFPNLVRVQALKEIERRLNPEKAEKEKAELAKQLNSAPSPNPLPEGGERGKQKFLSTHSGRKNKRLPLAPFGGEGQGEGNPVPRLAAEALWRFAQQKGVDLKKYPHYLAQLGFFILQTEIETEGVIQEIEFLENAVLKKLIQNQKEEKFLRLLSDFRMLEKFLQLELTAEEEKEVSKGGVRNLIVRVLRQTQDPERSRGTCPAQSMRDCLLFEPVENSKRFFSTPCLKTALRSKNKRDFALNHFFQSARRFYKLAHRRDQILIDNTLKAAAPGSVVVLITGGFHTPAIVQSLKEKNIGYAVIQPAIQEADRKISDKVFRNENAVSPYLKNNSLTKQEAIFLREIFEIGLPALKEKFLSPNKRNSQLTERINRHALLSKRLFAVPCEGSELLKIQMRAQSVASALLTSGNYADLWPPFQRGAARRVRSELRLDLSDLNEHDREMLQVAESFGLEVEGEMKPDEKKVVSIGLDSEMSPSWLTELALTDSLYQILGNKKPIHLGLRYIGLQEADRRAILPSPDITRIDEEGRLRIIQAILRGHKTDNPTYRPDNPSYRILPYVYLDRFGYDMIELWRAIQQLNEFFIQTWINRQNEPERKYYPRLNETALDWIRQIKSRPRTEADRKQKEERGRQQLRQMIFSDLANKLMALVPEEHREAAEALKRELLPNSYSAVFYTSEYGNKRLTKSLLEAISKANIGNRKSKVVFTFLNPQDISSDDPDPRKQKYKKQQEDLLELLGDPNQLGIPLNFYDFRKSGRELRKDSAPSKVTVINFNFIPRFIIEPLKLFSDFATGAGDNDINSAIAASRREAGPPVIPVPHEHALQSIRTQFDPQVQKVLERDPEAFESIRPTLRLIHEIFDLQDPDMDMSEARRAEIVEKIKRLLESPKEIESYRFALGHLVDDGNMFDWLAKYTQLIDQGASDPRARSSSFAPPSDPVSLDHLRVIIHAAEFITGHGDALRLLQAAMIFKDSLIHLADRKPSVLRNGLIRLSRVSNGFEGLTFLYATGDNRFLLLRKRAGPEKISVPAERSKEHELLISKGWRVAGSAQVHFSEGFDSSRIGENGILEEGSVLTLSGRNTSIGNHFHLGKKAAFIVNHGENATFIKIEDKVKLDQRLTLNLNGTRHQIKIENGVSINVPLELNLQGDEWVTVSQEVTNNIPLFLQSDDLGKVYLVAYGIQKDWAKVYFLKEFLKALGERSGEEGIRQNAQSALTQILEAEERDQRRSEIRTRSGGNSLTVQTSQTADEVAAEFEKRIQNLSPRKFEDLLESANRKGLLPQIAEKIARTAFDQNIFYDAMKNRPEVKDLVRAPSTPFKGSDARPGSKEWLQEMIRLAFRTARRFALLRRIFERLGDHVQAASFGLLSNHTIRILTGTIIHQRLRTRPLKWHSHFPHSTMTTGGTRLAFSSTFAGDNARSAEDGAIILHYAAHLSLEPPFPKLFQGVFKSILLWVIQQVFENPEILAEKWSFKNALVRFFLNRAGYSNPNVSDRDQILRVLLKLSGEDIVVLVRRIDTPEIRLTSLDLNKRQIIREAEENAKERNSYLDFISPFSGNPLRSLKTVLVESEIVPGVYDQNKPLRDILSEKFEGGGIEIISYGGVRGQRGGGFSSNHFGVLLDAVYALMGVPLSELKTMRHQDPRSLELSDRVVRAEGMTGIGGGFQDHIGGAIPGLKRTVMRPGTLQPEVRTLKLAPRVRKALKQRLFVFDSGIVKQTSVKQVEKVYLYLVWDGKAYPAMQEALKITQDMEKALLEGNFSELGLNMNEYWERMKTVDPNATHPVIEFLMNETKELSEGAMVSGAGGGGYLLILSKPGHEEKLKEKLKMLESQLLRDSRFSSYFSSENRPRLVHQRMDGGLQTRVLGSFPFIRKRPQVQPEYAAAVRSELRKLGPGTSEFSERIREKTASSSPRFIPEAQKTSITATSRLLSSGIYSLESVAYHYQVIGISANEAAAYALTFIAHELEGENIRESLPPFPKDQKQALGEKFISRFFPAKNPSLDLKDKQQLVLFENLNARPALTPSFDLWLRYLSQHPQIVWRLDLNQVPQEQANQFFKDILSRAEKLRLPLRSGQIQIQSGRRGKFLLGRLIGYLSQDSQYLKTVPVTASTLFLKTTEADPDREVANRLLAGESLVLQRKDSSYRRGPASELASNPSDYEDTVASLVRYNQLVGTAA